MVKQLDPEEAKKIPETYDAVKKKATINKQKCVCLHK